MQPALFTLCAGNELFYCLLYLFNFSEGPLGRKRGFYPALPGGRRERPLSRIPPSPAFLLSICLPIVGSVGLFRMGLWITAPIALLKSIISVIHLITAARNMAALDAADRAKKK